MEGFNWDEIKEQLQKIVKLDKNAADLTVKIQILEENIEENKMVGDMLQGEDEMKRTLAQHLGRKEPLDCDIEINDEEKYMLLRFKNKKDFKKVYKLLDDMFFGDFFKKMIEAMMKAFKGFAEGMGDAFGGK